MSAVRVLFAIARADFLERVRRYSFLVTLAATAWLGWLVIQGHVTLRIGSYTGIVNGPWAGALVAVTISVLVALAGFWVVKNSVQRDRDTRVGEILAATPMSKPLYTIGKFLSNFAVLAAIVAVLAVAAPILVALRGGTMSLGAMLSPFVLIALPSMAVVAALAVLFETIRPLSGGAGNVLWFFLWSAILTVPLATGSPRSDLSGMLILERSMGDAARVEHPDYESGFSLSIGGVERSSIQGTFVWNGIAWTRDAILTRLSWFGLAALIALVAAIPFDRFDASRWKKGEKGTLPFFLTSSPDTASQKNREVSPSSMPSLTPIRATLSRRAAPSIVYLGELRLMLKGRAWWFWAVAAGLVVAGLATPVTISRARILPFAWIWPILVWSAMGAREARDGTEELVFSAPHPLSTQIPALYLAGVSVAVAAGSGVALKCLVTGSFGALGGWLAGALFIPALALCLGAWSGGSKLFEAIYTVLWYVGPMQPVPALDFMGASDAALAARMPITSAAAAIVLVLCAVAGRRWKMVR